MMDVLSLADGRLHFESPSLRGWVDKYAGRREKVASEGARAGEPGAGGRGTQLQAMPSGFIEQAKRKLVEEGDAKMATGKARTYDYFCESSAAAKLLRDAIDAVDPDAIREAWAICEHVWARWKLQPRDLPLPLAPGERFRVLRDRGLTLINLKADEDSAGGDDEEDGDAPCAASTDDPPPPKKMTVGARLRARLEETGRPPIVDVSSTST